MTASPASSPRTNPSRTNNQREEGFNPRTRPNSDVPGYSEGDDGSGDSGIIASAGPSQDSIRRLDQVIQNFFTKAAYIVLSSRMSLPVMQNKDGTKKLNRWFSIETDDTTAFRDDLTVWRTSGGYQNRPPPLIVETYLDASQISSRQCLVLVDENGKRWDALEALNKSNDGTSRSRKRYHEIILERWKVELKDNLREQTTEFSSALPTIYKKCIVFFRSLYTTAKFTPSWKFAKFLAKGGAKSLQVKCRILSDDIQSSRLDTLTRSLTENPGPVTTNFSLGATDTPAGQFFAEVSWRNDCNFRVEDAESMLSSRFTGIDEFSFHPSLGKDDSRRRVTRTATTEAGSLPAHRQQADDAGPIQTYGSMSTFHGDAPPRGASPISTLRGAKNMGSDTSSPPIESLPRSRPLQTSGGSIKSTDAIPMVRRPSVSFQPFKAGSLSESPRGAPLQQVGDVPPPQSPQSLPRTSGISALTQARNRSSLTAGMPASLRGGPTVSENAVASSASSSPKPAPLSRYSSSFTHRRGRSSFGGASKVVDDDQGSSGKQSLSSSTQPGSGILTEGGGGTSSGSLNTDDDNISDFLKMLDSKKNLQSFEPSGEASTKRTSAQLSKFQSMRESNNILTESMSSSTLMHRSSSSSSRQLSSVPPMVAATSMSASSSPGKPISPHTPHTPAIPSRLSANSIAEYSEPRRISQRRLTHESRVEEDDDSQANGHGTNPIEIPTSPRSYYPHARRSSSVAQQHRALPVEEDLGDLPFALQNVHRSISLGADDREAPSLSALLGLGQAAENEAGVSSPSPCRILQPAPHITDSAAMADANESDAPQVSRGFSAGSANSPYRPRLGRMGGRGVTPPQTGSYSSLIERGSGSGTSERAGGGRHSFTRTAGTYETDDEPLLFDMSELGRDQSRRSLEEPRGGGSIGTSDRAGYDSGRGGDSGSSSRRGSRRGW